MVGLGTHLFVVPLEVLVKGIHLVFLCNRCLHVTLHSAQSSLEIFILSLQLVKNALMGLLLELLR